MSAIRRILGAYSLLLAIVVGVHYVITPLYDDGSTGYPVWIVLNWFIASGCLIALVSSLVRKLRMDRPDPVLFLEVNTLFYASLLLAMLFFWAWFTRLMSMDVPWSVWSVVDPLFAMVVGACGLHLWKDRGDAA